MTPRRCTGCGAPSRGSRCEDCLGAIEQDRAFIQHGLPPKLPAPAGIGFCRCGALRDLIQRRDGSWTCATCFGSAA